MTYTLLIVESPAKTKKIEDFLGPGFKCMASFGHIRELKGLKSIDFENNYKPCFNTIDTKQAQITRLRSAITMSKETILATDDDREGEAIAWHICQTFGLHVETTKRILFHEITKPAILEAMRNPTIINMDLVNAQLARQILDLMVGFKISPYLWEKISRKMSSGLSAGRCQTPALRLVYDNQMEINSAPGKEVYNINGLFKLNTKIINYQLNDGIDNVEKTKEFLELSKTFSHRLTISDPTQSTKKCPEPFTTSLLQQKASNELHISPKETMSICQKLYENGFITYMRTDSQTYSKDFIDSAKKYIEETYNKNYINEAVDNLAERQTETKKTKKKKAKKDENKAQEAHEAIRPTNVNISSIGGNQDEGNQKVNWNNKEIKLYKLIWSNTLESCMENAKYHLIKTSISAPLKMTYKNNYELVDFPGWKIVNGYEKENLEYNLIANYGDNQKPIEYTKIFAKLTLKELKTHYTEAKLVQLLEQKGIGRPSTFSSLIEKIQERGYVKKDNIKGKKIETKDFELVKSKINEINGEKEFGNEKNKLVLQPIGKLVIELLIADFDSIFNYNYTKNMENELDIIAKGEKQWNLILDELNEELGKVLVNVVKEKKTYNFDDNTMFMIGKNGPVIKILVGEKTTFKSVKKDIDINDILDGKYSLDEIIQTEEHIDNGGINLGTYKHHPIILKKGKFGLYLCHNKIKKSLNHLGNDEKQITLQIAINELTETVSNSNIIRVITPNLSIRNGKYGEYIYYKTVSMGKPSFLKLKGCNLDYKNVEETSNKDIIDWINSTYKININN